MAEEAEQAAKEAREAAEAAQAAADAAQEAADKAKADAEAAQAEADQAAADAEAAQAAKVEAAQADEKILKDPAPFIVIGQYKESSVEYIVRVWCNNADYWDVYFGMNERVRAAFAAGGVHMTYNHVNVHMVQ